MRFILNSAPVSQLSGNVHYLGIDEDPGADSSGMLQTQVGRGGRHAQGWTDFSTRGSVTLDLPELLDSLKEIFTSNIAHHT